MARTRSRATRFVMIVASLAAFASGSGSRWG